jgi:hypothetical protein
MAGRARVYQEVAVMFGVVFAFDTNCVGVPHAVWPEDK